MSKTELLRRAFAAHFRAQSEGQPLQPSSGSNVQTVGEKIYVVLRNTAGIIRVYRVRNDGVLKGLKRWPAAIK